MNVEILKEYCISKGKVAVSFPFGDDTLVVKTGGRIFALLHPEDEHNLNLKCDPTQAKTLSAYFCN
ncbi:MAG: MmcQ/YjbR family DNA-binding protein [Bacteroidales bacterium]|jgi:predicted DNA-binding protein (MmcQ/YjbR family)